MRWVRDFCSVGGRVWREDYGLRSFRAMAVILGGGMAVRGLVFLLSVVLAGACAAGANAFGAGPLAAGRR